MREIKFRAWLGDAMVHSGDDFPFTFPIMEANGIVDVMQFTGLHDKNGKDVYEGDVVEGPHGARGLIETIQMFKWIFVIGEEDGEKHVPIDIRHALIEMQGIDDCEVIGNIYESPELLNTND